MLLPGASQASTVQHTAVMIHIGRMNPSAAAVISQRNFLRLGDRKRFDDSSLNDAPGSLIGVMVAHPDHIHIILRQQRLDRRSKVPAPANRYR